MRIELNPMPFASSSNSGCEIVVPDQFPAGLRVLVVDDDPTCLRILDKMLRSCLYEVTKCNRAEIALELLRDEKNSFDIVISDVHMPDMDGFKLLEHVGLEMDLPVIMMSADDSKKLVMKGVNHGACDYLIKPVSMEALKNIWQHVVHRKKHEWARKNIQQSRTAAEEDVEELHQKQPSNEEVGYYSSSSANNEGSLRSSNERKDEEDECEERDCKSKPKKPRVMWSKKLHEQFISAVNQIGSDKAVPKKILEVMNVPGLTRENVASHLQKYRLCLRKMSGEIQNGLGHSFVSSTDSTFGPLTFASSSQPRQQSLAPVSASLNVHQRNIFTYENPTTRFVQGQQRHFNSDNEVNFLRGIPTYRNLTNIPFGNMNNRRDSNSLLTEMVQTQQRSQISNNGIGCNNLSNHSFSAPTLFSGIASVTSLPHNLEPETNASRGFVPSFDVFEDLNQNRTDEWDLQIVEPGFQSVNNSNIGQQQNILSPADNLFSFQNSLFTEHDEFMNTYLDQNQQDVLSESEFDFNEYQLDSLPL
ncbi:hypothetical protein ABFS82_14G005700 [Erythranthe guttata]|nr:PREDICTED: two-component response regulator ARR2-like isoform X2 [Erythranthe guttata]|eukprot:XP_012840536.1 PREDICTED: two-component response regulator ARR2-like isoform X2 [Erythranthe guttata]